MKQFFTLSIAALAASAAMAGVPAQRTLSHGETSRSFRAVEQAQSARQAFAQVPVSFNAEPKAYPYMPSLVDKRMLVRRGEEGATRALAANNFCQAYYNLGDGVFYPGLAFHEKGGNYTSTGFYFTGNFMISQAFNFTLKQKLGRDWASTNPDKTSFKEFVDADGNLDLSTQLGVGSWYGPQVSVKRETYWYCGKWAAAAEHPQFPNGFDNAGVLSGYIDYDEEDGSLMLDYMAPYDPWENITYVGFGQGQYAFGSHSVLLENGDSHATLIDAGNVGGGLVVDHLQMQIISGSSEALGEGGEMYVTIADITDEGEVVKKYTTVVTGDDLIDAGSNQFGTSYAVMVYFNEIDEDGFASELSPVIDHNLQILIEDNGVNCDYGFFMNCDDRENEAEQRTGSSGNTYYMPLTAVRTYLLNPEDGQFYGLDSYGANATVDIVGYYNYLGDADGNREVTAKVFSNADYQVADDGTKYTWAISAVLPNDKGEMVQYNDFDLQSSFDLESWSIEYDEDVVLGWDIDDQYLEQYGIYAFYIAVSEMPEGVTSRTSELKLYSNDEVSMTFTIVQGEAADGINTVVADNKKEGKTFNLQGQVADAKSGLMVKDGKVIFVK